jgi:hypothetical protein
MRRREFAVGIGSAAAWSMVARAQQGDRVRRIGVLMPCSTSINNRTPRSPVVVSGMGIVTQPGPVRDIQASEIRASFGGAIA